MAFQNLQTLGYVKKQSVLGSFSINKRSERGTFFVSVPSVVAGKPWDAFSHCSIALGDGDDAGLVRICGEASGAFKIARLKHALVFRVPEQRGWAAKPFANVALEVVERGDALYVLRLPQQLLDPEFGKAEVQQQKIAQVAHAAQSGAPAGLVLTGNVLSFGRKAARLPGGNLATMIGLLMQKFGQVVRYDTVVAALWGDDPNGGPEGVDAILKVNISKLRTAIEPLGLVIITHSGIGWSMAQGKS